MLCHGITGIIYNQYTLQYVSLHECEDEIENVQSIIVTQVNLSNAPNPNPNIACTGQGQYTTVLDTIFNKRVPKFETPTFVKITTLNVVRYVRVKTCLAKDFNLPSNYTEGTEAFARVVCDQDTIEFLYADKCSDFLKSDLSGLLNLTYNN